MLAAIYCTHELSTRYLTFTRRFCKQSTFQVWEIRTEGFLAWMFSTSEKNWLRHNLVTPDWKGHGLFGKRRLNSKTKQTYKRWWETVGVVGMWGRYTLNQFESHIFPINKLVSAGIFASSQHSRGWNTTSTFTMLQVNSSS